MTRGAWFVVVVMGAGCGPTVDPGEGDTGDTGPDPTADDAPQPTDDGPLDSTGGEDGGILLTDNREVDVLFVVDNSGSMGEENTKLAFGVAAMIDQLETAGVGYRVGVTTTDNGNPLCAATSPEAGKLVATSCRERTAEFVFDGAMPVDVTQTACLDVCGHDQLPIVPTTTEDDPEPKPRPWIERIAGVGNLDGVATREALACLLPQGVAGCGFEQPLESMYKAMLRAENTEEAQYGFVRDSAALAVVVVSDETDCSHANEFQSIFLPASEGGDQVFWSDPSAAFPTSAVCWNAGVVCTGGGSPYDECHSENKSVSGEIGVADENAVLLPMSRYVEFVQGVEWQKQELAPGLEVVAAVIGGVPADYETGAADLVYADAADAALQGDFGIGPGCVNNATNGFAIPPVREREFAEAFQIGDQRNLYSICSDDFAPALAAIGDAIADQFHATCFPACAADTNPVVPGLDPECSVVREAPDANGNLVETDVPACVDGAVPPGAEVCFVAVSDVTLSPQCIDEGWNLEFRFVRAAGVHPLPGESFRVNCELSTQKNIDCPNL